MEQISNERYQEKASTWRLWSQKCDSSSIPIRPASRPNGAWSFNMTPARWRGGYGSRDCEGTRAYH